MNNWLRFFAGTPQRFLATLATFVALGVFVTLYPGLLNSACQRLVAEISPVIALAIQLGVTIAVIVFMLKAVFKK